MWTEIKHIVDDRIAGSLCTMPKGEPKDLEYTDSAFGFFLPHLKEIKKVRASVTETQFYTLSAKWKDETAIYSTDADIVDNDSYRELVKMGIKIVPYILKDLDESVVWFPLLQEITKANPVPRPHIGDSEKMREAWLDWGRAFNFI